MNVYQSLLVNCVVFFLFAWVAKLLMKPLSIVFNLVFLAYNSNKLD